MENTLKSNVFVFTADHEEPCCGWCDHQDTCDGVHVTCGPKHSWAAYRRTVRECDFTEYEASIVREVLKHVDC